MEVVKEIEGLTKNQIGLIVYAVSQVFDIIFLVKLVSSAYEIYIGVVFCD